MKTTDEILKEASSVVMVLCAQIAKGYPMTPMADMELAKALENAGDELRELVDQFEWSARTAAEDGRPALYRKL